MNRYHTDIKRQRRNIAISAAAVIAFIILAYSVGAKEGQPPTLAQRGWCVACHHTPQAAIRTYGEYRRIVQGKTKPRDAGAVSALNEQIRLARLITE